MSDAQVPEKVYTKQWWTEEDLEAAAQAIHRLACGDGLSHVGPECPHYRHPGDADHVQAHASLVGLTPTIERIRREAKAEALRDEAEWLKTAHANSIDKGYSREYRSGFEAAQGWVRLHAQIQEESTR